MSTVATIINIIAIIAAPIIAVWIGQKLQDRAASRKDKMAIFQCLMTHRATGWAHPDTVNALNSIDIVFADNEEVRNCWADLLSKYKPNYTSLEINTAQCKLLEAIANSLGYGKTITWAKIQNPYLPDGLLQKIELNSKLEQGQQAMAEFMINMKGNPTVVGNTMLNQTVKQEENANTNA